MRNLELRRATPSTLPLRRERVGSLFALGAVQIGCAIHSYLRFILSKPTFVNGQPVFGLHPKSTTPRWATDIGRTDDAYSAEFPDGQFRF